MEKTRILDHEEYLNFEQHKGSDRPDYYFDSSAVSRRVAFYHGYLLMRHIEARAESKQPLSTPTAEVSNFAELRAQDECVGKAQSILQKLESRKRDKDTDNIESGDIIHALYEEYKGEIWLIMFLVVASSLSMLGMTISFQLMVEEVISLTETSGKAKLYLLITLTTFLSTLANSIDLNLYYENASLVFRARQPLILLFYVKTMGLTSYNINQQNMEKLVNGISSDFNVIEQTIQYVLLFPRAPIKVLGIIAYLIVKLNWIGLVAGLVMGMTVPIHFWVGKKTGLLMGEVNTLKDERIKFYSQIIDGIKFIKIYGWQVAFTNFIQAIRTQQTSTYVKYYVWNSISQGFAQVSVMLSGYILYLIIYASGQGDLLSTAILLATLQAIINLRSPMSDLFLALPSYYTIISIFSRFGEILSTKHIQMENLENQRKKSSTPNLSNAIELENFYAYWKSQKDQEKEPTLKNLSIALKKNLFYGVTGRVGSGKSSFFQIFLQQIPFYRGNYQIQGKVAYVQQEPVLFSETVQMNILMGRKLNRKKYESVLQKSCFTTDLQDLESGDQTLIGEKGIKLSGGQRVRLSLARALYSDAEILLFDDPISALDSKVSKSVFEKSILPLKGTKTILLITHQLHFLMKCDKVILFEQGRIKAFQKPDKLQFYKMDVLDFEKQQGKEEVKKQARGQEIQTKQIVEMRQNLERRDNVNLDIFVYCKYFFFSKLNWILLPITILLFILVQALIVIYFSILSTYDKVQNGESEFFQDMTSFWIFLGIIQLLYLFLIPLALLLMSFVVFRSNSAIHESMIEKLIRSHLFYFDVIPNDQLLNRFSNDLTVMDTSLCYSFKLLFERLSGILVTLITVSALNLPFIGILVIGIIICIKIVIEYKNKVIYSKKVHLLTKDPIFKSFTEVVTGNMQLRLAGQCRNRVGDFSDKLNRSFESGFESMLLSQSLGIMLSYSSIILIYIGLIIGAYFLKSSDADMFGVQMVLLIKLNAGLGYVLREVINNQTYIVSAERALQVTSFETEGKLTTQYDEERGIKINYDIEEEEQPLNPFTSLQLWPENPSITIQDLQMKYRKQLPLVLKGVNFSIKEGQRVGIVGRTGAGKSSIFQALLRMTEPESGSGYQIGSYDALKMGLHSLRRNISVIPQSSFLLNGSIRRNLDPFERKSDGQLWEVLERVSLKDKVLEAQGSLDTRISNSQFFSVGEKQLFCLARVLLYPNKVLILDEATSNVDLKTDSLVQECIKEQFKYASVLAIAHRLDTIADYDKILVIEKGKVVETGTPQELVAKKGLFWEMIEHTGANAHAIYAKINQTHNAI